MAYLGGNIYFYCFKKEGNLKKKKKIMSFFEKKCFNGPTCKYLAEGRCNFYHPKSDFRSKSTYQSYSPIKNSYKKYKKNEYDNYEYDEYDEYDKYDGSDESDEFDLFSLQRKYFKSSAEIDTLSKQINKTPKDTNLMCPYCKIHRLIEKEELNYYFNTVAPIYYCNSCRKRVTVGRAQKYNYSLKDSSDIIKEGSIKKAPISKIKEFLSNSNLPVSGSKVELWSRARTHLGFMETEEEKSLLKNNSIKKYVLETTNKYNDEFSKTFVVPPAALKELNYNKFSCSSGMFGQNDKGLQETYGIGCGNLETLEIIENDFSVGLSKASRMANIVFYAPKKKKILCLFPNLTGLISSSAITKYFDQSDNKIWSQICLTNDGKRVAVIQREAGYTDHEKNYSDTWRKNCYDQDKKEWGFLVDIKTYSLAWEEFLDYKNNGFPGLFKAALMNAQFSNKIDPKNVKKMKVAELKAACLERGLIKTNEKVLKAELVERLLRVVE